MKFSAALSIAAAGLVAAQTPAGFEPYTNNSLLVDFPYGGGTSVHPVGILLNDSVVADPPSHISTFAPLEGSYMVAYIDSNTTLYDGSTTEALQWLQTDMTQLPGLNVSGPTGPVTVYSFKYNESEAPAQFVAPLATKAPAVHTFVILLFKQPDGWAPNDYLSKHLAAKPYSRIGFDLSQAGLGEPLFATYFTLDQNTTAGSSSGAADDACTKSLSSSPGAADFCYLYLQDVFTESLNLPYFASSCSNSTSPGEPSPAKVSAACSAVASAPSATATGGSWGGYGGGKGHWGGGNWGSGHWKRGNAAL